MPREPGTSPQFDRMLFDLTRAQKLWIAGNPEASINLLRVVTSIISSELSERQLLEPGGVNESNPD